MANEWIPVKYLPDETGLYLVYIHAPKLYNARGHVSVASFNKYQGGIWEEVIGADNWCYGCYLDKINTNENFYISHWMKFPESPISLGVDYEP